MRWGIPAKDGSREFAGVLVRIMDVREAQSPAEGQIGQRGERAVQMVAPASMSAWFQLYAEREGRISCASVQISPLLRSEDVPGIRQKTRERNRWTFTSTMGTARPNAEESTARAVYGPMPGSASNAS
jgi:hypothetical protein